MWLGYTYVGLLWAFSCSLDPHLLVIKKPGNCDCGRYLSSYTSDMMLVFSMVAITVVEAFAFSYYNVEGDRHNICKGLSGHCKAVCWRDEPVVVYQIAGSVHLGR